MKRIRPDQFLRTGDLYRYGRDDAGKWLFKPAERIGVRAGSGCVYFRPSSPKLGATRFTKQVQARWLRTGDFVLHPSSVSPCVVCSGQVGTGKAVVCSLNGNRHEIPHSQEVTKLTDPRLKQLREQMTGLTTLAVRALYDPKKSRR